MADQHSAACCTLTVAAVSEYSPKGSWIEIHGVKTYMTGPATAKKAIIQLYDIFGYSPQTFQGADILSTHGTEPYLVFVPDFIGSDRAAKTEWVLPGVDKKPLHELLGSIYSEQMNTRVRETISSLQSDEKYAHVERWAGVGFCWGSKIISSLVAKGDKSFDVTGHTSPSRIDPEEAKMATVPTIVLSSKDEDASAVRRYVENLKGEKYWERFEEVHGWMSARGALDQERPRKAYARGYKLLLDFLAKYL